MSKLIGLNGSMGCGKSEAFKAIKESASTSNVVLVKFAQPLYDIQEMVYDRVKSVYTRPSDFIKDRKLLQWIGTDWGRALNENLWADIWKSEVTKQMEAGNVVVCDDVRFDNEAALVKSMGGAILRIISNRNGERIDLNAGIKNHASEAGIKENFVDITIANNSSLEEYKQTLSEACKSLGLVAQVEQK